MKKPTLLLVLLTGSFFMTTGCSLFEGPTIKDIDEKEAAEQKAANSTTATSSPAPSPAPFSPEFQKTDKYDKPVVYSGPGTRTDYFCTGGECETCENPGTLTIILNTDGTSKLSHVGQCNVYGINGCTTQDTGCEVSLTGAYSKAGGVVTFNKCNNGIFRGNGNGQILDENTTGEARCEDNSDLMTTIQWSGLPKVP